MGDLFGGSGDPSKKQKWQPKSIVKKSRMPFDAACMIAIFIYFTLQSYIFHSTMLASEAYSSPSIIMSGRRNDGSKYIIDDYREAYYWIKQNTPKEAKVMSWWDYGY
jgi:dolichyl-diphosphooligosaccharide--protein glycosyltransferase